MVEPDQTNAGVSDERLREITSEDIFAPVNAHVTFQIGHPRLNVRVSLEEIRALATELLTRRSVTSQASEGEVVAQLIADGSHLVYDADEKQALMFLAHHVLQPDDDSGFGSEYARIVLNIMVRLEQALKVVPVSKRVERLETALRMLVRRSRTVVGGLAPGQSLEPAGANHTNMFIAAIEEADALLDQALQGGRS